MNIEEMIAVAKKATPGPWKKLGMGNNSLVLSLTHKWHDETSWGGYPIAIPRTYMRSDSPEEPPKMHVDFPSAGFAHEDAAHIATFDPETCVALCRLAESAMKIAPPLTDAGVKLEHARDRLTEILERKS